MASIVLERRSALAGLEIDPGVAGVAIRDAGAVFRLVYRGDPEPGAGAFGMALPAMPLRAMTAGERAALWLGPDEWLLLGPATEATTLQATLMAAIAGKPAAIVDVSHRNFGLVVSGPRAADVLASQCPLDLDLAAFPAGMCTRTLYGKCEVVLWRMGHDAFRVEALRSYAPYLVALLREAAETLPARA